MVTTANAGVTTMKKAKGPKAKKSDKPRRRPVKRFAALVIKDEGVSSERISERYQLLLVPLADEGTAVDNFNERRMYGADATPNKRAVACLVFFQGRAEQPYERQIQESLAYVAKNEGMDEAHPLHQLFCALQLAALHAFATGYELGYDEGYSSGYSDGRADTGRRRATR